MKGALVAIALCLALLAGCGDDDSSSGSGGESNGSSAPQPAAEAQSAAEAAERTRPTTVNVPKGAPPKKLFKRDLIEGTGPTAKVGDRITVHYIGVGSDGEEFEASWDRKPFTFSLGAGDVITGWDRGIVGMKEGGRRELTIPPALAYGAAGSPPAIGPNETLVFVIDLFAVE